MNEETEEYLEKHAHQEKSWEKASQERHRKEKWERDETEARYDKLVELGLITEEVREMIPPYSPYKKGDLCVLDDVTINLWNAEREKVEDIHAQWVAESSLSASYWVTVVVDGNIKMIPEGNIISVTVKPNLIVRELLRVSDEEEVMG